MVEVVDRRPEPKAAVDIANAIAVASGKGGVGKTWFSISLCHALARAGKKVLLFDGDLGLANVDIQLGLSPKRDLSGVLANRYELGEAVFCYPDGGFDIIAGQSGSGNLTSLPADRLMKLVVDLAKLAPNYDHVVLDLGAGVERTVRQLAARARCCLVVTTDEPTAMTDAYAFMKLLLMKKRGADLRIVVNMAAAERDGERTYGTLRKACESFLKFTPPLAGTIRREVAA